MKKKISLKDIASKVGVSTALVSYVLNNQKSGRIRKEVALKIKQTAQELNYRPNQIAKSLKLQKTFTLGLIVADISNPFFSSLARIIEDEADKNKYTVIFGSADEDAEKSCKLLHTFHDRQVDGLIIAPAENGEDNTKYLLDNGIPFVMIDRYFPDVETNWICLDNYEASLKAVHHFAKGGIKRPALVTYKTKLFNLAQRKKGFVEGLRENGIIEDPAYCRETSFLKNTKTEVEAALEALLKLPEPPDAVLFASNILALHGLRYIHANNIRVPDQLALITFDELDASDLFYAPLTFLRQPIREIGQLATQCLLAQIDKPSGDALTQIALTAELVVRQSTHPV